MPMAFSTVDWGIVGVYLLLATIPGFFCRKYIKSQDDFLVAGRSLSVWLATATLTATEMGLITVMYMSEMGFVNGFSAMVLGVIALGTTLFVGLTGFMVAGLRRSGATTVAEYYEQRYSRGVRVLGGLIIAAAGILNYGVFLKVEANFIRIITGVPDIEFAGMHIPSINLVMSVLVAIVLLYTLLGGMVSVVLTDYIQFIVMTLGLGAVTWWVLTHPQVGGFSGMVEAVNEHRSGYGLNPTVREMLPGTKTLVGMGWVWIIWQTMHWLGTNTWQTQAFRTAATDSPRTARAMWSLTAINYFGRAIIPMLWGVAAIAFLSRSMSPAEFEAVGTQDAMPLMLQHLPMGLVGFMLAGMLAALMSTHSSYMLAWSGVLTEDLVAPVTRAMLGYDIPSGARIWITRFFILCLGAFLIVFGLWYEFKDTVWGYLGVTGTMYVAGAISLVAMGLYWRRANEAGAYLGLLLGAAPSMVYLAARFSVLGFNGPDKAPGWLVQVNDFMTDPVTGIMSFPLGLAGMIVGSLFIGGGERAESDRQLATASTSGGAA